MRTWYQRWRWPLDDKCCHLFSLVCYCINCDIRAQGIPVSWFQGTVAWSELAGTGLKCLGFLGHVIMWLWMCGLLACDRGSYGHVQPFVRTCHVSCVTCFDKQSLSVCASWYSSTSQSFAWLTKLERWFTSWDRSTQGCGQATTWIVDEAETEESTAGVSHLNTIITRLCYECPKDE